MKSRTLTCITAMTLFAALTFPVQLVAQHTRYKLIDLGTFGGPLSYVEGNNGVNGAPNRVLNNRGTVTGWADTAVADPFPASCYNPDCFVSHAFRWEKGILMDLGALPKGHSSSAVWISDSGLIAGASQNGEIDPLITGFPEFRAVVWRNGRITDLGTLGGNESAAFSVNNRGQVVGAATNNVPDPFSFVVTQIRAFLWQKGVMNDLGTLGGPEAWALFVNERGQIAGFSLTNFTANPTTGFPTQDPFLWEQGRMLDLGTLGGTVGSPHGLNNRGQVVGTSNLAGDTAQHPFFWDRGVLTDLGTFGGDNGEAQQINDSGDVVGSADFPGNLIHDAALWRQGVIYDLGAVAGDACSRATSINSKGQVVGGSSDCHNFLHAFLWEDGGPMIDLNTVILPDSGLQLTHAVSINDRGEIVAYSLPLGVSPIDDQIQGHTVLLIPCNENHSEPAGCGENSEATTPVAHNPMGATNALATTTQDGATATDWADRRPRSAQRYYIPGSQHIKAGR